MAANLPILNASLTDFCYEAKQLLEAGNHADFVKLVLSGEHAGQQVVIDPIVDSVSEFETFKVVRDYDSLLGIDSNIPVSSAITVFPVAKKEDTLARSIHISGDFTSSRGAFTAPVHKIPNLCIAKWDTHNSIRVLLPELYHEHRSQFLSQDEQRIFYEHGLRPAVQHLLGDQAAEWPATYDDEMFRARGHNGQLSFQSKIVPSWHVAEIGDSIRSSLEQHGSTWGTGLVFLMQIRGVKHSTSHSHNPGPAEDALRIFLEDNQLDPAYLESSGQWWIDVGAEISSEDGNCLAWRTDSHYHIVKEVCRLSHDVAVRITSVTSSKYTRDMASHLPAVSGCRISPGSRARGAFNVQYLQLYTTDKSLTYRPDGAHYGKFIACSDVLRGKATTYINKLYELYGNAIGTGQSHARIEVRVPLAHASVVLLDLDDNLTRDSLVSIDPSVWWSLRSYRALALKFILEWQAEGDFAHRSKKPALLLTTAAVWLLNGLHSTPDKGASSKELMTATLPHIVRAGANPDILAYGSPTADDDVDSEAETSSDEDNIPREMRRHDAVTLPSYPYGLVFLRKFRAGPAHPVPRFDNNGQFISDRAVHYFFGIDLESIRNEFFRSGIVQPSHPSRVANKSRTTPLWVNWAEETPGPTFDLARRGYRLPAPPRDEGSDMEVDEEEVEEGEEAAVYQQAGHLPADGTGIDMELTNLWRQFLLDITSKAPNSQNASQPSHCRLSAGERTSVTEATYTNRKLSDYFRDCQWKIAEPTEWTMIFNRLFPKKNQALRGKIQNYTSTKYYPAWQRIKDRADDETFEKIRRAIRVKFDELYWMPAAQTDRIWWTKFDANYTKSSGLERRKPSPLVLINPECSEPTW